MSNVFEKISHFGQVEKYCKFLNLLSLSKWLVILTKWQTNYIVYWDFKDTYNVIIEMIYKTKSSDLQQII